MGAILPGQQGAYWGRGVMISRSNGWHLVFMSDEKGDDEKRDAKVGLASQYHSKEYGQ